MAAITLNIVINPCPVEPGFSFENTVDQNQLDSDEAI